MMCIIYKNSRMKLYKMPKLIFVEKKVEIFKAVLFTPKTLTLMGLMVIILKL